MACVGVERKKNNAMAESVLSGVSRGPCSIFAAWNGDAARRVEWVLSVWKRFSGVRIF